MKRVVIIGGGNLAESLAIAIAEAPELELSQIYLRRAERGEELTALTGAPYTTHQEELAEADLYIIGVSDAAIAELSLSLPFAKGAIVAHTAGSTPMSAINPALRRGVFYPMQTFTKGRRVDFGVIPIFIEAEEHSTLEELREVASLISGSVTELTSEKRRELHLSAVYVCNFVNAMYMAGEELTERMELPFDILRPLIEESTAKLLASNSPRTIQTGPAVRGDVTTQERHCEMLAERDDLREIYRVISKYIWETSKRI